MSLKLIHLEAALEVYWDRETSSDPENWSHDNRAWGQCAVTALVVQDYLGGKLVWAPAVLPDRTEVSHYFNEINGHEYDLSRSQFPAGTVIPKGIPKRKRFPTTRDYVLSYPATQKRYELLSKRVRELLEPFMS